MACLRTDEGIGPEGPRWQSKRFVSRLISMEFWQRIEVETTRGQVRSEDDEGVRTLEPWFYTEAADVCGDR